MSVPLPGPGEAKLTRPDAAEVAATARGIASVVVPAGGLTDLQRMLLEALFPAMTDHHVDLSHFEPMSVDELAEVLSPRDLAFRTRCAGRPPGGAGAAAAAPRRRRPGCLPRPDPGGRREHGRGRPAVRRGVAGPRRRRLRAQRVHRQLASRRPPRAAHLKRAGLGLGPGGPRPTAGRANDDMRAFLVRPGALPLDEVRAWFGLRPKSPEATSAGSVGPWVPGGISPFQLKAGRAMAAQEEPEYASYGASPD